MGLMQRVKGKRFERAIAAVMRKRWPDVEIRRSSQAERAYESDVFAKGHAVLERCWFELEDAADPAPMAKLAQAERDISVGRLAHRDARLPVIVWHKLRARTIHVTTRMWVLDELRHLGVFVSESSNMPVTLTFDDFLDVVEQG